MKLNKLFKINLKINDYEFLKIHRRDIMRIRDWRNNQINILRQSNYISKFAQKKYYKKEIKPIFFIQEPKQLLFSYYLKNELIGYGGLTNIDWRSSKAEVSFLVSPKRIQDNNIYSEDFSNFLKLLKHIAFKNLNLNRLVTETYDFRIFHIELLEKNGFVCEGRLRENYLLAENLIDSVIHSCLKGDYNEN
jgi:RimJ/RimL family protein N-acetyltransferase